MKIYVVSKDPIADGYGELLFHGNPVAAFTTEKAARAYIENVEETCYHKRRDYTVDELELNEE